jgi:WD40 repeat protein
MSEFPTTVDLKGASELSTDELLSVIELERERRWAAGDRVPIEEYLRTHPAVAEGEPAVRLVYGEFLIRERAGERPALEEYQHRFPALAERLAQQIELHHAVGGSSDDETKVSGGKPTIPNRAVGMPEIAGFEILGELGRGGMAVVYRARDTKLNRIVALKVIKSGSFPGDDEVSRFQTEAEVVARLRHPHIVQIFEVGNAAGMPYMALEFVSGGTLAHKLRETPLSPRAAAELTELLARALEVAHGAGVIHRDLKPGNILLAEDGSPRVADFGLAKRTDVPDGHTHSGAILGTPSYMAPEQAAGQVKELGPGVDVYALGAILYECLTGRPPFKESSVVETLTQVCTRDPVPPSRLLLRLPSQLEAVCLKCLEKSPARRYASAGALADDLRRWLDGKPTLARPVGMFSRGWKLIRRNPVIATATVITTLALLVGVAVAWVSQVSRLKADAKVALADAESERLAALTAKAEAGKIKAEEGEKLQAEERKSAEQRAELGRRANYSRLLGVADRFWEAGSIALAEDSLDECPSDLRGCEWHFRRRRNNPDSLTFRATSNEVGSLAISPGGKLILTGSGAIKNLDQPPGTVDVWNAATRAQLDMPNPVTRYAAVGGAMMVAGLPPQRHTRPVCSVAFQPGGSTFVSASRGTNVIGVLAMLPAAFSQKSGEILVWDATSRQVRFSIRDALGPVAFSADGKRFAACTTGRLARVWDVTGTEWKELPALAAYPGGIKAVALSPDGRQLAVAGYHVASLTPGQTQVSYELGVYDLTTGQKIPTGPKHDGVIECVAFSPDGRTLVAGCEDGIVRQWDLTTGQLGARLHGHKNAVLEIAFSAGGKWLATGSRDQTVRLWDWKEGAELRTFRGHDGPVWTVAFAPTETGEMLVSGGGDGVVRTWNPQRNPSVLELTGHQGMINSLALSPDRPLLATVCRREALVRVWNLETGRQVTEPMSALAERVAFGPGGLLATAGGLAGSFPGQLILWDATTGKTKFNLTGHKKYVTAIAFSPDGRRLASAAGDPMSAEAEEVKVWDTATGKELFAFRPRVGMT